MTYVLNTKDLIRAYKELKEELEDMNNTKKEIEEEIADLELEITTLEKTEDFDAIEFLEKAIEDKKSDLEGIQTDLDTWAYYEDYEDLESAIEQCESYNSECEYGVDLIEELGIKKYVEREMYEIFPALKNIPSFVAIDWDDTIDNYLDDFGEVQYDNKTYYIRIT
jgi:DNA repair exonuclease SbcCD ATPase subunit